MKKSPTRSSFEDLVERTSGLSLAAVFTVKTNVNKFLALPATSFPLIKSAVRNSCHWISRSVAKLKAERKEKVEHGTEILFISHARSLSCSIHNAHPEDGESVSGDGKSFGSDIFTTFYELSTFPNIIMMHIKGHHHRLHIKITVVGGALKSTRHHITSPHHNNLCKTQPFTRSFTRERFAMIKELPLKVQKWQCA